MKKILSLLCLFLILPAFASNVTIESKKQVYDAAQNKTFLDGGVKVRMDDITVKSPRATVDVTAKGEIDKANFLDGVYAIKDNKINQHEITSDIMTMSLLNKKIRADGSTVSTFCENRVPTVIVHADSQEYDVSADMMKARGNVVIDYQDIKAKSNEANLKIDGNSKLEKLKLIGNGVITEKESVITANNFVYNPKSNEIVAMGNVHTHSVSDDGAIFDIYSNYQQYDRATTSYMTSGSVKITYQNYIAMGPKATFLPQKGKKKINKIIFYGRSTVQEGDKIIEADKIILTLKPKNFTAEGNVKTSFKNVQGFSDKKN
jgi:lipopolysaccharide assembly outer membrane protein LptD (OstA)